MPSHSTTSMKWGRSDSLNVEIIRLNLARQHNLLVHFVQFPLLVEKYSIKLLRGMENILFSNLQHRCYNEADFKIWKFAEHRICKSSLSFPLIFNALFWAYSIITFHIHFTGWTSSRCVFSFFFLFFSFLIYNRENSILF